MSRPNTRKNHTDGLTLLPLDHGKLDIPVHHRHPRHSKEDSRHRHSACRVPVVPGNDQTALFGAFKRVKEKIERQHELNSTMTTMVLPIRICNVMILFPSAKTTTTGLVVAASSSFGLYFLRWHDKTTFHSHCKGPRALLGHSSPLLDLVHTSISSKTVLLHKRTSAQQCVASLAHKTVKGIIEHSGDI
jgi:hypothetical protein